MLGDTEEVMATFHQDERGAVGVFVLVLSIGLLAMMGLVMDTGRTFAVHTQGQAYVDNVALAMARELDGQGPEFDEDGNLVRAGARDRAKAIMSAAGDISEAAIQKSTTMAGDFVDSGATDFEIFQPIFLTAQPNTDGSSL
ncbi:MAG: Tad domain-containing protein, partial [Pseudomonadota bacterium]